MFVCNFLMFLYLFALFQLSFSYAGCNLCDFLMSFPCYFWVLLFARVPAFWGEPGERLRVVICVGSAFCGRLLLAICLGSCPLGRGQPCLMLRPLLVLLLLLLTQAKGRVRESESKP